MRLIRFGEPGEEKPGILDDNYQIRSLAKLLKDIDGSVLSEDCLETVALKRTENLPIVESGTRIGPCLNDVETMLFIDACNDLANTSPKRMSKPTLHGSQDKIFVATSEPIELALGIAIGEDTSIAGYCLCTKAGTKILIGPWLVTCDEFKNPEKLKWSFASKEGTGNSSGSAQLPIHPQDLVSEIASQQLLVAGDIIAVVFKAVPVEAAPSNGCEEFRTSIEGLGTQSPYTKS